MASYRAHSQAESHSLPNNLKIRSKIEGYFGKALEIELALKIGKGEKHKDTEFEKRL